MTTIPPTPEQEAWARETLINVYTDSEKANAGLVKYLARRLSERERERMLAVRQIVCEEWQRAVREFALRPSLEGKSSPTEAVIARILIRLSEEFPAVAKREAGRGAGRGARIVEALKDAVAGEFSLITIEGQTWVRKDASPAPTEAGEGAMDEAIRDACMRQSNEIVRLEALVARLVEALRDVRHYVAVCSDISTDPAGVALANLDTAIAAAEAGHGEGGK